MIEREKEDKKPIIIDSFAKEIIQFEKEVRRITNFEYSKNLDEKEIEKLKIFEEEVI